MKKIMISLGIISLIISNLAYGHKLISHDETHKDFDSALQIPDHKISWVIYENLGPNKAKFYSFDAKKGDSFYANIVIPKINGLEEYSPTVILVNSANTQNNINPSVQRGSQKFFYEGNFPGSEFYEPFGQVTYWERQEIKTNIPTDGKYFIIVVDEKNQSGKYSLAIGTIEDFSGENIFVILLKSWWDTKIFVNDYISIGILFLIVSSLVIVLCLLIINKRKAK